MSSGLQLHLKPVNFCSWPEATSTPRRDRSLELSWWRLKIHENAGQFLRADGTYEAIDKIEKDDLLRLVDQTLDAEEFEVDAYDEQAVKNQAHQVIYKSIAQKLTDLRKRREAFIDESARLYLAEYEKYRE